MRGKKQKLNSLLDGNLGNCHSEHGVYCISRFSFEFECVLHFFFPFVGGESCDFTYINIFYKKKGGKIKAIMDNKYLCSSYLDDYEYV